MRKSVVIGLMVSLIHMSAIASNPYIENALKDPARSEKDVATDMLRKPGKVLSFLEVKPGQTVLDVFSGSGYYTEIAARVVGPKGHVDAHNNAPYVSYIGEDKLAARYGEGRLPNVTQLLQDANALNLQENHYDRILFILSFHDLYHVDEKNGWDKIDDKQFMAELKKALKPGGYIGVVDHVAAPGSGSEMGNTIHRIDPQIIRDKMQQWGFKLVGEADFLQNLADPLDLPMWDPKVRGRTHRAVLKFTK